ncbi:MAG: outer membrane lipoprotein carrier protein LolA [Bacteroidetes bacterium]|nr:outer membrane lipoprotein carrier protein LolA [Bacteroidota bacterium]
MKKIALFALALSCSALSIAQSSKEVLDKLSAKAKTWSTLSADFSSSLVDKKNNKNIKQEGNIKIKGKKYTISLSDYQIFTDGTTIWTYDKKSNTCTIDNLKDVKDGAFDPSEIFTIWEKDFKNEMKNANATVDGIASYEIALYPNNPKGKSYHTILMYVDKGKNELIKAVVKTRDGGEINYRIKNLKPNAPVQDGDFNFQKSKYPKVEMVDNRL